MKGGTRREGLLWREGHGGRVYYGEWDKEVGNAKNGETRREDMLWIVRKGLRRVFEINSSYLKRP